MKNCTDCILDDEVCECFVGDKETEVDLSRMFEESEDKE